MFQVKLERINSHCTSLICNYYHCIHQQIDVVADIQVFLYTSHFQAGYSNYLLQIINGYIM